MELRNQTSLLLCGSPKAEAAGKLDGTYLRTPEGHLAAMTDAIGEGGRKIELCSFVVIEEG